MLVFGAGLASLFFQVYDPVRIAWDAVAQVAVCTLLATYFTWRPWSGRAIGRVVRVLCLTVLFAGMTGVTGSLTEYVSVTVVVLLWGLVLCGPFVLLVFAVHDLGRWRRPRGIERRPRPSNAQWTLAGFIVALALGIVAYRWLHARQLEQTAALFIGLPALLAAVLALTPRAETTTGMVMKGITIALLSSGVLVGEGFVCILMAAPLFYLVGLLVVIIIERVRRPGPAGPSVSALLALPLLGMSVEGVPGGWSLPRAETVAVTRTWQCDADAALRRLDGAGSLEATLPPLLRLGFPRPVALYGSGLAVGDRRAIYFAKRDGTRTAVTLEVVESGPGFAQFAVVEDKTHMAHWLRWRSATVQWNPQPDGTQAVTWTVEYKRLLDPAWYFGPLERYGVALCIGFLLDAAETPRG